MVPERHLCFADFAPRRAFHAALLTVQSRRGHRIAAHTHDFYEIAFVLAGEVRHRINGADTILRGGQIALIRPPDCHSLVIVPGQKLHKINIAFPAAAWASFLAMASVGGDWVQAALPPVTMLSPDRSAACARIFQEALSAFQDSASPQPGLDLCRFLTGAVPFLLPETPPSRADSTLPVWLASACEALRREPLPLAPGLERFVALCGVSHSHLTRTLKAATGSTPTDFINAIRLTRAATLLTTTALPIIEISADCGFGQLSYFYRLFRRRYGIPPRLYRLHAHRSVGPS